jgi:hypothetical protein
MRTASGVGRRIDVGWAGSPRLLHEFKGASSTRRQPLSSARTAPPKERVDVEHALGIVWRARVGTFNSWRPLRIGIDLADVALREFDVGAERVE